MDKATVAISSDFLTAFSKLPRQIQGKITEFINKFRNNPYSNGINYEKINNSYDNKIWSVRIDRTYRGIVARQEKIGVFILLWIDHHDDAYAWASRKKCIINPITGNIQVFDIVEEEIVLPKLSLFNDVTDKELIMLGVPNEQISLVRSIEFEENLYTLKNSFPEDAYEALEWLANGFPADEVAKLFEITTKINVDEDDFEKALDNLRSQKSFAIIEGEEDLKQIMAEPLEKWRVFLHPSQRKIVSKEYSGPTRILGGAGTGKTVIAMHRAKYLASRLENKEKILFTTFTNNLAADIMQNLRKICTVEELKRIEVVNLDAWVGKFMREQGFSYTIAYGDKLEEIWEEAVILAGEDAEFPINFYKEEWLKVVSAYETYKLKDYVKVTRVGRGVGLNRGKRIKVWKVFEAYQNVMKDKQLRDSETAMYECRNMIEKNRNLLPYVSVIVDEAQDLSMSAFRLLRAIAGEQKKNDIFIVGDTHQRIYKNKVILSHCGINIIGRSNYLRINYRTTEEIRKYAFSLLKGINFDDLDDEYDSGRECHSLTHGSKPEVRSFSNGSEELDFLVDKIKELEKSGVEKNSICIVCRTNRLLESYAQELTARGIRTYRIKRSKAEDRHIDGVRIATMHRVKGLEFRHMFVVSVNNRIVPLQSALNSEDPILREENIVAEKCLLYVALTRAQESAYITSYGQPSEFLV